MSIVFHEFAHAVAAVALGDPTPRWQGRLSLNPLVHFEPVGLILMLIAPIGWAKPVMCDTSNFRHPRLGMALVAIAGPLCNLILACICFSIVRWFVPYGDNSFVSTLCFYGGLINVNLCLFNLIPIPPLDGSRILAVILPQKAMPGYLWLERYGAFVILLLVVVFNRTLLQPLFQVTQSWVASWFQLQIM